MGCGIFRTPLLPFFGIFHAQKLPYKRLLCVETAKNAQKTAKKQRFFVNIFESKISIFTFFVFDVQDFRRTSVVNLHPQQHLKQQKTHKKMKKNNYIRQLRQEVRTIRRELKVVSCRLDRNDRIDELIKEMKRSAREMLLISREL